MSCTRLEVEKLQIILSEYDDKIDRCAFEYVEDSNQMIDLKNERIQKIVEFFDIRRIG